MAGYVDTLRPVAESHLEPGETLLAGARGMRSHGTAQIVGGIICGVASTTPHANGTPVDGLPAQIAVGLTDRRLLVFKRGGISGRARDLVATIPRASIVTVEGVASDSKLTPDWLTATLDDGAVIHFEIVTMDNFESIVSAFARG